MAFQEELIVETVKQTAAESGGLQKDDGVIHLIEAKIDRFKLKMSNYNERLEAIEKVLSKMKDEKYRCFSDHKGKLFVDDKKVNEMLSELRDQRNKKAKVKPVSQDRSVLRHMPGARGYPAQVGAR